MALVLPVLLPPVRVAERGRRAADIAEVPIKLNQGSTLRGQ